MDERIKKYIDEKVTEVNRKNQLEKEALLLKLGFFEKEYSPDNKYSDEYYESESDGKGTIKYYKKVPIEINDEEYAELLKYSTEEEPPKSSILPMILTTIACVIFLFGFLAGIAFGNVVVDPYDVLNGTVFSFAIAFTYWSIALISGSVFLALAEIIRILDKIKNK